MIEIVVIGASAGGVEAAKSLVEYLPADLQAAFFLVLHFPEDATSVLPQILNRHGHLSACHPSDGDRIQNGRIYVAPPGSHMLVKRGYVRVVRGPKENGHRPAIDPLFRSAAINYKRKVAGVILSGLLDDGVMGLNAIKREGGQALVQDPHEAFFPDMPKNAIAHVSVDLVAPIADLAAALIEMINRPRVELEIVDGDEAIDPTEMNLEDLSMLESSGVPSTYTCPECNGTLFELVEFGVPHYRCRVGHSYTAESLESHQSEELEAALWEALRSIEENLALSQKLLERAKGSQRANSIRYYSQKVENGAKRVELLRNVIYQTIQHPNALKNRRLEK